MKQAYASSMVELLTPIWQRVLQRSEIGEDDNFFDLGGDSSAALELFNEIASVCGRELPPVVIYHASTIASLAALLEEPTTPSFPPLVLVRSGDASYSGPPLFITHGLGGSVIDFYQVVKHMHVPNTIHGMQARGLDGVDVPFDRIEDMAALYLEAVRELQPHGPYLLIGYSLGGLVTLEMAQRLSSMGEEIALLAMLDSYPHPRYLTREQRLRWGTRWIRRHTSSLAKAVLCRFSSRLFHESVNRTAVPSEIYQLPGDVEMSPTIRHVRDCAYQALQSYRPRFYPGRIRFVRAAQVTEFPADPVAVWSRLAKEFMVDTVPGDHLGIMTAHFEELGKTLSRYVIETQAKLT